MGEGTLNDMTAWGDVAVSAGEGAWNELRVGEGVAIPTPSGAVTQTGVWQTQPGVWAEDSLT